MLADLSRTKHLQWNFKMKPSSAEREPTHHVLKTWPIYWWAMDRGEKNFEVRRDDRGFQRGDILILRCWDPQEGRYMKSSCDHADDAFEAMELEREITWVLTGGQFGIAPGHVVLGLREIQST